MVEDSAAEWSTARASCGWRNCSTVGRGWPNLRSALATARNPSARFSRPSRANQRSGCCAPNSIVLINSHCLIFLLLHLDPHYARNLKDKKLKESVTVDAKTLATD